MKCIGDFIYKGIEKRDGGEFVNDKGQAVKYDDSYVLRVDEVVNGVSYERKLKVSKKNTTLVTKLQALELYKPVKLSCDVTFYGNTVRVIPVELIDSNNK